MKMIKKDKKNSNQKTQKNKKKLKKINQISLSFRNNLLLVDNRIKIGDQVNMQSSALVFVFLLMGNQFSLAEVMTSYSALENKENNGNNFTG